MTTDATTLLDSARWSDRLGELIEAHTVPGAALAIARTTPDGGRDLMVVTAGVTNLVTGTPVLPDTLFQIGSHTKIWTATLLMQLVDEGLLDLDEPVVKIVPGLELRGSETGTAITTRHLLTHMAGIDGDALVNWEMDDRALEHFTEQLAGAGRVTEVGELWSYSNIAFSLAGRIVEVLRGTTWEEALRTHVVKPLGLEQFATSAEEAILGSAAVGHLPGEGGLQPTRRWGIPRKDNPAGGIPTRVADLAEFMLMHLRGGVGSNGNRILSEAGTRAMLTPQVLKSEGSPLGEMSAQGIGWHLYDWSGTEMFGHDGGTFGQYAHVLALPAHDLVVALTIAGGDVLPLFHAIDDVIKDALHIAYEERTIPVLDPIPAVDPAAIGHYEREAISCRVFEKDGKLQLGVAVRGPLAAALEQSSDEQVVELTVLGPRRFCYGDAQHLSFVEFLRTDDGNDYLWMDLAIPKISVAPGQDAS